MLPQVQVSGRAGSDPTLRFTPAGKAVCSFSIPVQDRKKNAETNRWEDDGPVAWVKVVCWDQMAEQVADQVVKGSLVLVTGRMRPTEWEDKDGNIRKEWEIQAQDVGVSLKFAPKAAERSTATGSGAPAADQWAADGPPPF